MQGGDGSYRRVENPVTAVSKGHHKLWLILQSDCLMYYNGNGIVWKVFYEKILDNIIRVDKYLDRQLHVSLAKGYGYKFVQPLKTIIYVAVLSRGAFSLFCMVQVSKGR